MTSQHELEERQTSPVSNAERHRWISKPLGIAVAAFAVAWVLYGDAERAAPNEGGVTLKRVKVAAATSVDASRELRFAGTTRASRRARLAFTSSGRLTERPVEIGDRVRAGQILARLDDRELSNAANAARGRLSELRARLAQAERDRRRDEELVQAKAATAEELERAGATAEALAAAVAAAEARLSEAERLLAEARLTAPFGGDVTEVLHEPGEHVVPGQPVVVLSGDGGVEVEVEVPEGVAARLLRRQAAGAGEAAEGEEVQVDLPLLGRAATGRLLSVGRAAAGPGHLFPVVVRLDDEPDAIDTFGIAPGMSAEVAIELSSQGALALPVEAIVNPGGRAPSVFRVVDGRVEKLAVEVGELLGDRVVVSGSLAAGDQVVVGGQRGLLDGEEVEVMEATP